MLDIDGLVVPPATPFGKNDLIDEGSLAAHLAFLAQNGVKRILINGTTAEFFSLLPQERKRLLKVARGNFGGTIFFNTASDSMLQALDAVKWAEDEGADAIVSMLPYYYAGAPVDGLIAYLNRISESTSLPMVLYNFTKHAGNAITPEILKAVDHVAIKDSSGDYSLIGSTPCYLAGTSSRIVDAYKAGARGFVSATANYIPELYVRLESLLMSGEIAAAEKLQSEINDVRKKMTSSSEISGIKRELSKIIAGYPEEVRLPLVK